MILGDSARVHEKTHQLMAVEKPNPLLFFAKNPPPNGSVSATHNGFGNGMEANVYQFQTPENTHTLKKETNHLYLNIPVHTPKYRKLWPLLAGSGESQMDGWRIW